MTDTEDVRAEAFRLFEQEKHLACLDLIHAAPPRLIDTRIQFLEAVCLYSTGLLEEAEVCLRDIRSRVPDSAEVCLYLGKILEQKGDDGARAEFAEAVRLEPDHPEAIRRYARYLSGAGDHRAALCLFRRLTLLTSDSGDLAGLMQCYAARGQNEEGIERFHEAGSPDGCLHEYLKLLFSSGRFQDLIDEIRRNSRQLRDHDLVDLYLSALIHLDPDLADREYLRQLKDEPSATIASHYVDFLTSRGEIREALGVWSTWLAKSDLPEYKLQGAPLLEVVVGQKQAIELYVSVLFDDGVQDSSGIATRFLSFRDLMTRIHGPEAALDTVLTLVRPDLIHGVILGIACWCEEQARPDEAKRLFLQALRSDLTKGGLAYAAFLGRAGEKREQKKILDYILKTLRKVRDLEVVAGGIVALPDPDPDLLSSLISRLDESIALLSQQGRELFAQALILAAESELQMGSPDKALEHALKGLAIVPVDAVSIAESLFALLVGSKNQVLPDYTPSLLSAPLKPPGFERRGEEITFSWLEPGEEAVVEYLRKHRVCNEMDLRKVAGTRRVAGLMNKIMRKAEEQGVHLADKEGYSEFGEVYRYAGP